MVVAFLLGNTQCACHRTTQLQLERLWYAPVCPNRPVLSNFCDSEDAKKIHACASYEVHLARLFRERRNEQKCPGGFAEGECGPYKVIGHRGGTNFYFDAKGGVVGWVSSTHLNSPCDLRAFDPDYHGPLEPGATTDIAIGDITACTGVWLRTHCAGHAPQ